MARKAGDGNKLVVITGVKAIDRRMKMLPDRLKKKVIRQAIRKALKPVQVAVKAQAPVASGQTKRAVRIRAVKSKKRDRIALEVKIGAGDYKGDQYYAAFVQYGHNIARPRGNVIGHVQENPFMSRAFLATAGTARQDAMVEIAKGVNNETGMLRKLYTWL